MSRLTSKSGLCRLALRVNKYVYMDNADKEICYGKCPISANCINANRPRTNGDDLVAKVFSEIGAKDSVIRARRRARIREAGGVHTDKDICEIRKSQDDKCGHCLTELSGRGHVDHIFPLARGGSNWPHNLQLLCAPCNMSKGSKDPIEFMFGKNSA